MLGTGNNVGRGGVGTANGVGRGGAQVVNGGERGEAGVDLGKVVVVDLVVQVRDRGRDDRDEG